MTKREEWEKKVAEWWDANKLGDFDINGDDDVPPEAPWGAFEFIYELMKIKKED